MGKCTVECHDKYIMEGSAFRKWKYIWGSLKQVILLGLLCLMECQKERDGVRTHCRLELESKCFHGQHKTLIQWRDIYHSMYSKEEE